MHPFIRPLAACVVLALAAPAAASPGPTGPAPSTPDPKVRKIMRDAGLMGAWAQDCSRPPSDDNGWETITLERQGVVSTMETPGEQSRYLILDAGRVNPTDTWMRLRELTDGVNLTLVYRRDGDRQMTWASQDSDGEDLITDGVFSDGTRSQWYHRCTGRKPRS